jgi:riboflavin kinase/FMN adenylyltransferase
VGVRPSINRGPLAVEAHLLDFDDSVYDQSLTLDFVARLRDELVFPTADALAAQIRDDIVSARAILGGSRSR